MNISLQTGHYKSIYRLSWHNIPNFGVITGKNGCGKTQLLELINFQLGTDSTHKDNVNRNARDPFCNVSLQVSNFSVAPNEVVFVPANYQLGNLSSINASQIENIVTGLMSHFQNPHNNQNYVELAAFIEGKIGKPKNQIQKHEVLFHLPVDYYDYVNRIFIHEGLQEIFLTYHAKSAELREEGKTQSEIVTNLGEEPWVTLNRLLEGANFKYIVNKPKSFIGNYDFRLVSRKDKDLIVDFSDLSSGEKMLLSLAVWLFNSNRKKRLPKLLLLDEPDAHLHPSAIKDFIEVIENVLVKQYGVRVLMTTHSPSTVALAPDHALFEMSADQGAILPLKSKDFGISMLSEGLLTVRENTKYVLVEDSDDAKFYTETYKIFRLRDLLNPNIGILFLPSSNPKAAKSGGNTVVKAWVEKFVTQGLDNMFQGLVDLDNGTNTPQSINSAQNLHIISRYSLENYLLDPILVYCSSLHQNQVIPVPNLQFEQKDEYKISKQAPEILQAIADYIFNEVEKNIPNLNDQEKLPTDVSFIGGYTLKYPLWLISKRGHDLFGLFKSKYQSAIEHHKLINTMIRQEHIPKDLLETFKKLQ